MARTQTLVVTRPVACPVKELCTCIMFKEACSITILSAVIPLQDNYGFVLRLASKNHSINIPNVKSLKIKNKTKQGNSSIIILNASKPWNGLLNKHKLKVLARLSQCPELHVIKKQKSCQTTKEKCIQGHQTKIN